MRSAMHAKLAHRPSFIKEHCISEWQPVGLGRAGNVVGRLGREGRRERERREGGGERERERDVSNLNPPDLESCGLSGSFKHHPSFCNDC